MRTIKTKQGRISFVRRYLGAQKWAALYYFEIPNLKGGVDHVTEMATILNPTRADMIKALNDYILKNKLT